MGPKSWALVLSLVKPFLLLATRADDDAAEAEHAALCSFGGLSPDELRHIRLESNPMPDIDLADYSGVFLGGSPFNSSEPHPSSLQTRVEGDLRKLVRHIVASDHPFFGACYGVGILGTAFDGVVDTTYGETPGPVSITLTNAGRADPLLKGLPDTFSAIVGHKEACRVLPSEAILLASGADCPVQLFKLKHNVYACQFHPELDAESLAHRLHVYAHVGYCPPEEAEGIVAATRRADLGPANGLIRAFVERYHR